MLDRLTQAPSRSYTYDANGNRTQDSGQSYTLAPDSNRLHQGAGRVYDYDANGNPMSDGRYSYTYDSQNRLTEVQQGATVQVRSSYNALGQRVRKESPTGTTHYLYSADGQLLAELDAQGNTQREYLYLQSWPVAVVSYTPAVPAGSGTVGTAALLVGEAAADENYPEVADTAPTDPKPTTSTGPTTSTSASERAADGTALGAAATPAIQLHYLHPDHLGTPRLATDSAQRVIWRWDSAPFGDSPALEDPDGDGVRFTLNLRFPGQYFDTETGLHYNYYRDYDPVTGRYLESDPIGLRGGVNTYGYVGGRPLQFIDFLGLCKCIAKGKGGIGDKNSKYIGTLLGSRRIITCKYECEKPNGEKVPVTGTHIEEYWYSERYDDGSEGDCIGAVFDSSYNYQTMRLVYSRISFEPFDAASSPSQELQRWDKENCRDCPSK